jgi:thiosulfate reductase cytochrome b subunit
MRADVFMKLYRNGVRIHLKRGGFMMAAAINSTTPETDISQALIIRRHGLATRLTHWLWALALFFLLLSGLQIFNAHPTLYLGQQSGFAFDNGVLSISAARTQDGEVRGVTTLLGRGVDTTGVLGVSGAADRRDYRAFPAWLTVPSYQDLATGRVIHFFFAWLFATVFLVWLVASLINGHLWRDILPSASDISGLPRSFVNHVRFRFDHGRSYNGLQKLSYAAVLLVFFPLMILTGLTMSPGMDAAWPWLIDVFAGRQTARTIHFVVMLLLVGFFAIHIFMVFAAGPINELRSMITGRYRIDSEAQRKEAGQ